MGRPEPCVLFAQTFVHPYLDEYVDEVLFAEPIVVTGCEFLEQNASSASQALTLVGATSPPSFALEVFVQCEGETRFRRLCQPFLYSHYSSNVLEVEAVVTNHLVVRGSYRSLSLVIYGNTAEDLGQFNIECDDSSITNLVTSAEGKIEDLPLALRSSNRTIEESLSSLKVLSLPSVVSDITVDIKKFLQLTSKVLELSIIGHTINKVVSTVVSAASLFVSNDFCCEAIKQKHCALGGSKNSAEINHIMNEARKELLEFVGGHASSELLAVLNFLETEADLATSKQLVDMLSQYFDFQRSCRSAENDELSQNKHVLLGLGMAVLLCSGRESCFHFVNGGGMEQIAHVFSCSMQNSSPIALLLLGVIEQATRYSVGCEGFLGWWPREDENIPSGISKGYSQLLKLFLQKPRHDVASLATYVLHRLRFYEVVSRYENAVLSVLEGQSARGRVTSITLDMLISAKLQLENILKLINSRGPVEDPSPAACTNRSLFIGQAEGLLSYKATSYLIGCSTCCFSNGDMDLHLLTLLKERGFIPLSAALLASPILHSEVGDVMETFVDIASTIGAIVLALLSCRSGLIFLSHQPDLAATLVGVLKGADDMHVEECVPLRYASVLISKGFVCSPREVGMILEIHLRVVNAIDRLLLLSPDSEEFLWVLWELCGLSRSNCGLQALLILGYFPEALKLLIEALHSVKEPGPISKDSGTSPPNIAIFHSAAEIFEIIVTDSTASSLSSWIEYAIELQKALCSSSPGSNRKDAPARLLEWIDAGVVYHKNGVIGVLRYAAVLASGGDAHLSSTSILVSDLTDMDNVDGDSSASPDLNVVDNLGKVISEKTFDGVTLRDSSVAQLTTAMRILAFISENSTVATTLYDEGAITVIYAVLVNCSFMLERFSNSYDYLVDESTEGNSTSDLLVERYREQSLVDLLVPSLVLLSNLLHKLQEANEQHRNTKLMNALLRLHREVSTKLVACAADLPSAYPDSALGFGAVCHLIVSAVACWPVYGWTPGLFHSLITSVQATSLQALGPKEACSFLCILNDLFPEEGIWLWRNGMPLLCGLRTVAVGTLLGPLKGRQVDWYLEAGHLEKLLCQLNPQLDKIAQIVQHYAISALAVIQDMLRVLIIRIASQKGKNASVLLRPILSWIQDHVSDLSPPSDVDAYKVCRFLDFIASLLEHPRAKALVLEEEGVQLLLKVLERCFHAIDSDGKQSLDSEKAGFTMISWCLPVFKSFALLCNPQTSLLYPGRHDTHNNSGEMGSRDCSLLLSHILKFCQVLPVGKQLLSCLTAFKELGSCYEGRQALFTTVLRDNSGIVEFESERQPERDEKYILNDLEWSEFPLLCCWKKLLKSVDAEDVLPAHTIEAVNALCLGSLCFCIDGKSLDLNAVAAIRCLFGLPDDVCKTDGFPEDKLKLMQEMTTVLSEKMGDGNYVLQSNMRTFLYRVSESARLLLAVLENNNGSFKVDDIVSVENVLSCTNEVLVSLDITQMSDDTAEKADDSLFLGALGEKFLWECPETLPDRLPQPALSGKRKIPPLEGPGRRIRGDNSAVETTGQNSFLRGSVPPTSSGPTRRDIFRQRKPNTSRPPSMHVDDYVTRERSVDGVSSSSNVIAIQRVGLTGGRPPSIHVDEFMARQRERQNPMATVVGEGSAQVKNVTPLNDTDMEKADKSKQLKSDLDDDFQGIDIVFDAEENESDDKLPFPQPDDNLQQPAPLTVEQSSSHSIVEETENDADEGGQFSRLGTPLYADENAQSEFSSRMSVSRPEVPLTREPSVSSDKKFPEQSEDFRNDIHIQNSSGHDSAGPSNSARFPAVFSNAPPSVQLPADSRMFPQNFYAKNSPQHAGSLPVAAGSRGLYDQKNILNQPPLPPMPPPQSISHAVSQSSELAQGQSSPYVNSLTDGQPQVLTAFQVQSEYARTTLSSPSRSARHPPLPPTPPPFSSSSYNFLSVKTFGSQYNQITSGTTEFPQTSVSSMIDTRSGNFSASGQASYPPLPLMPPSAFSRPSSVPMTLYGSAQTQQLGENPTNMMHNLSIPLSSIQSVHSLVQLQPLQPPQIIRPLQPPQHFRPPIQGSQQLEQVVPLHNPGQMQMLQQPQVSPNQTYYQSQQPEFSQALQQQQVEHSQLQVAHQQGNITSQQLQDSGMSLHEYFKSPEAIQSLLSDRDKLCQLLEQHPKLMQMLQEKLGQL